MHGVVRKVLIFLATLLVSSLIVSVLASFNEISNATGVGMAVSMAVGLYLSIIPYCKVTVPNKAKENASLPNNHSNYFLKHWHGEHSIARSFWINYALVNLIIAFVMFFLIDSLSFTENPQLTAFLYIAMWIGYSLITIWQLVGLWRSGGNYRRILRSHWGTGTQILAVFSLWALQPNYS